MKRFLTLTLILFALLSLPALAFTRRNAAPPKYPGITKLSDLQYGTDPLQTLDVYIPDGAKNLPVILMVHGGGWQHGGKGTAGVVENKVPYFLDNGFVFISINYRLVPQVDALTEAHDVARALAYAQQRAPQWGGDPKRFIVMGFSAGANLVSVVTTTPSIVQGANAWPWLGTVVLDSAAYNVQSIMERQHNPIYDPVFAGHTALQIAMSPILQITGPTVPMMLVCETVETAFCDQAQPFADINPSATLQSIDLPHGEIDSQLGLPNELTNSVAKWLCQSFALDCNGMSQ